MMSTNNETDPTIGVSGNRVSSDKSSSSSNPKMQIDKLTKKEKKFPFAKFYHSLEEQRDHIFSRQIDLDAIASTGNTSHLFRSEREAEETQEENFVDNDNYINEKLYRYIGYTKESDITQPKSVIPLKDNEDNLEMAKLLSEFRKKQRSFESRCRGLRVYYEPNEN